MKRVLALVLALTSLSVMFTGCSSVAPAASASASAGESSKKASYKDTVSQIVLCYLPNEASDTLAEYRGTLEKDLSAALGIKVTEVNAADYNAAVEAMRTGKADLVFYGPVSYCQAAERSGAEALAVIASNGDKTKAGYTSKIIVKAGSPIKALADLKGKTFAFVDPASTSGNYVPTLELMTAFPSTTNDNLHTNGSFFSSVTYSGKHQNGLQAVLNGDVDAAPIASDILDAEIAAGRVKASDVTVIHESKKIPASPMAVRGSLPQDLKDAIKSFFLNYNNADYFQFMMGKKPEEKARFVPAADSDYDYVRALMEKVIPKS